MTFLNVESAGSADPTDPEDEPLCRVFAAVLRLCKSAWDGSSSRRWSQEVLANCAPTNLYLILYTQKTH